MAASFVKQYTAGSSTAATAPTATTITAPASGNVLVACVTIGSSTANASVTSIATTGGTWARVAQSAYNATGTNRQEIWVCSGTITGTSVAFTFSATSKYAANIQEWSGLTARVDVTAVTNTGSVATGTNTTTSTALSSPGGSLVIGAMSLARSNASTDFSSTSGAPDARTALTWFGSGATTVQNVAMQAVYDVSSAGFTSETFSWVTTAAWQYAWAAVTLHAKASTTTTTATLTGTVSRQQAIARAPFSGLMTGMGGALGTAHCFLSTLTATCALIGTSSITYGFVRTKFTATCTALVTLARACSLLRTQFAASLVGSLTQSDTFSRADQSGWGTASDGDTWSTPAATTAPTLAISGNEGTIIMAPSALQQKAVQVLGSQTYTTIDIVARVKMQDTQGNTGVCIVNGNSQQWTALTTQFGGVRLSILNGGTFSTSGITITDFVWVRLFVQGSVAQTRCWKDGTTEPTTWQITTTTFFSGPYKPGVYWQQISTSPVATAPALVDSFSVRGPLFGSLGRQSGKGLTVTLQAAVTFVKAIAGLARTVFSASVTGTGLLGPASQYVRAFLASCTATVSFAAAQAAIQYAQALAASIAATAAIGKDLALALSTYSAALGAQADVVRTVGLGLTAELTLALALLRVQMDKALAAALAMTVPWARLVAGGLHGTVLLGGALAKDLALDVASFAATLTGVAETSREIATALAAALSLAAEVIAALVTSGAHLAQDLAGACVAAPALLRQTTSGAAGALRPAASLGRDASTTLAASLAGAAALARTAAHTLAASLTLLPATARAVALGLASTVPGSATLVRALALGRTAWSVSLDASGAVVREAGKVLTASLAAAGQGIQQTTSHLAASLAVLSEALRRRTDRQDGATLTASAASTAHTAHQETGALPLAGVVTKLLALAQTAFAASGALAPALSQETGKVLAATVMATAQRGQQVATQLVASLTPTMTLLIDDTLFLFAASLTLATDVTRRVSREMTAALAALTDLGRDTVAHSAALLESGAVLRRGVDTALAALLGPGANLARALDLARARFEAALPSLVVLGRDPQRVLTAVLVPTASLLRAIGAHVSATVEAMGSMGRGVSTRIGVALVLGAQSVRQTGRTLRSTLRPTGAVRRVLGLARTAFSGSLALTAGLGRRAALHLISTVALVGQSTIGTTHRLAATLGLTMTLLIRNELFLITARLAAAARLTRRTSGHLAAILPAAGTLVRGLRAAFSASLEASAALGRGTTRVLIARLRATVVQARGIVHNQVALLRAAGVLPRNVPQRLAGALPLVAGLLRRTLRPLAAACVFAGHLGRASLHTVRGVLRLAGVRPGRAIDVLRRATLAPQAGLFAAHRTLQALAAALAGAGALVRTPAAVLAASLQASGSVARASRHGLGAVLGATARTQRTTTRVLRGALAAAGALQRATVIALDPATLGASLQRFWTTIPVPQALGAQLTTAAALGRQPAKALGAILDLGSALGRAIQVWRTAVLAPLAAVAQTLVRPGGRPWTPTLPREDEEEQAPLWGVPRLVLRGRAHVLLLPRRPAVLALRAHAHRLMERRRTYRLSVQEHVGRLLWRAHVSRLMVRPHARRLLWRPQMQLVPEGNGLLAISPEDKNLPFDLDYREDIPPRVAIKDYRVSAQDVSTGEDVTDRVITHTRQDGPTSIRIAVGNGDQTLGTTYRIRCTVVLSNDPPTELPGHFDLPCIE